MTKTCACGCGDSFESDNPLKKFINKQHCDRSRNLIYSTPSLVTWESIADLRHFSKLSEEGKRKVLLGEAGFNVCMFDIEATHLKANVGRIICCSFKPLGDQEYTFTALDRGLKRNDVYDDSKLAAAIRDELEKYDIIVGWNSRGFDVKYINARNLRVGQRTKKAQKHVDGMWSWRTKAAAWSGLASVQQFITPFGTSKTSIKWEQWMRVLGWSKRLREEAMEEIVDHCERDVVVLEEVYRILANNNVIRSLSNDGGLL